MPAIIKQNLYLFAIWNINKSEIRSDNDHQEITCNATPLKTCFTKTA